MKRFRKVELGLKNGTIKLKNSKKKVHCLAVIDDFSGIVGLSKRGGGLYKYQLPNNYDEIPDIKPDIQCLKEGNRL